MIDHQLASLLSRWHQWRRAYSHERGYARSSLLLRTAADEEDELERMAMQSIDEAIATLTSDEQIALQHVARAECLGVDVFMNPRLGSQQHRQALVGRAVSALERRLLTCGVL
jgi:hypothetical protein